MLNTQLTGMIERAVCIAVDKFRYESVYIMTAIVSNQDYTHITEHGNVRLDMNSLSLK